MTAGYGLAGAPSSGVIHVVAPGVYREVAARQYSLLQRVLPRGVSSGSSRMTRKCHVRFLGGRGAVMPPGYPTGYARCEYSVEGDYYCGSHRMDSSTLCWDLQVVV